MLQILKRLFHPHKHHVTWNGVVYEQDHVSLHQELDYDDEDGSLNRGSFGKVYRGKYHLYCADEPEQVLEVAVKQMKTPPSHSELKNLLELRSEPEIVHLYNYREDKEKTLIVTELCAGGDLMDYMLAHGKPTNKEARRIVTWLLRAVQKCHKHGICHADIKFENIGLVEAGNCAVLKLLDFGKSVKVANEPYIATSLRGTERWTAPELFDSKIHLIDDRGLYALDAWSIGVVTYCLLFGQFPFAGSKDACKRPVEFLKGVNISDVAKDFMTRLLNKDPAARMTIDEALEHSYISHDK